MTDQNKEKPKIDKYLTDIKELPPSSKEESNIPKNTPVTKIPVKVAQPMPEKPETEKPVPEKISAETKVADKKAENVKKPGKKVEASNSIFTFKDISLGVINFVSIILLIFLLTKLPLKAKEFQEERIKEIQNQTDPVAVFGDISEDKKKAAELESLFLDESGVVEFVNEVEKLKGEGGAIQRVAFTSQVPVKDANGFSGLPVVIELRGDWSTIGSSLQRIQALPFLFKPIAVDAQPAKEDTNVVVFNYGGLLYVNDKFGEGR